MMKHVDISQPLTGYLTRRHNGYEVTLTIYVRTNQQVEIHMMPTKRSFRLEGHHIDNQGLHLASIAIGEGRMLRRIYTVTMPRQ